MTLPTSDQYYKAIFMAIAQINKVPEDTIGLDGEPFKHFTIKRHLRNVFIRAKRRAEILGDYHYYLSWDADGMPELIAAKKLLDEKEEHLKSSLDKIKESHKELKRFAPGVLPFLKKLRDCLPDKEEPKAKEEDGK